MWLIIDSALVLEGDQKKSLLVDGEDGSQARMTSTPGCSLTSWVIVLNGRWSVPLGFTLARIQGDLNVRSLTYLCFQT